MKNLKEIPNKMMIVITGGSGSGKSAYAESYITKLRKQKERCFYIATMQPYGEEGKMRVEKHRAQRAGKGFVTIECYQDLEQCIDQVKDGIVLLECMSNFVANQMFGNEIEKEEIGQKKEWDKLVWLLKHQIELLRNACKHFVIVTNEVFSDGIQYEKETMDYIEVLGRINQILIQMADEAIEVVYSIPILIHKRE